MTCPVSMFKKKVLYSREIWRGITCKFGALEVCLSSTKLKSAKFFSVCMYVWQYRTIPPNLNLYKHRLGQNPQI